MLILFDNGTPAPLRDALQGHIVVEAIERGWDRLTNGELIAAAEAEGFERSVDNRQKHPLPTKPERPENRLCGYRQPAMAHFAPLR